MRGDSGGDLAIPVCTNASNIKSEGLEENTNKPIGNGGNNGSNGDSYGDGNRDASEFVNNRGVRSSSLYYTFFVISYIIIKLFQHLHYFLIFFVFILTPTPPTLIPEVDG